MKLFTSIPLAVLSCVVLVGCSQPKAEETAPQTKADSPAPSTGSTSGASTTTASLGVPVGSVKVGDKGICAVCAVKEGKKEPEEVKATVDYKGKTYTFCNESEKAEFISDPAKYASAK